MTKEKKEMRRALFEGDGFPGRWRQGYYTIGTEVLVDYKDKTGVWVWPVEHIEAIYKRTEGSGGGRTTSFHLPYRTQLRDEDEQMDSKPASWWRWCVGTKDPYLKKVLLGREQGGHIEYWWKHDVKRIPTWSQKQAQNRMEEREADTNV